MKRIASLAVVLATATVMTGCAKQGKPSPIANNAPEWVNKGSGAFKDSGGKQVFYGVGSVQGVRNIPLARASADDYGRAELAKIMNSYVTSLTKGYMASVTAGDMSKSSEEQMVSSTMKNFTKFTLAGSVPVDHWVDKENNIIYSLVKLDMGSIQQTLNDSKELNAKVRDYVKANAEKAFDELSAEEAKR